MDKPKNLGLVGQSQTTAGVPRLNYSFYDFDILARTIYGEARGEPWIGKVAVAHVVLNRMNDPRWPNTVAEVCLQRKQFSCWNPDDPMRPKVLAVDGATIPFQECLWAAYSVLRGEVPDPTNGANHYYAPSTINPPRWAQGQTPVRTIGRHRFFKL